MTSLYRRLLSPYRWGFCVHEKWEQYALIANSLMEWYYWWFHLVYSSSAGEFTDTATNSKLPQTWLVTESHEEFMEYCRWSLYCSVFCCSFSFCVYPFSVCKAHPNMGTLWTKDISLGYSRVQYMKHRWRTLLI